MMRLLLLLALAFALAVPTGCAPIVGDSCDTQTDCGRRMFCELSMPDGYCTLRGCVDTTCPDRGVCIRFDADVSYCMARCEDDGDCRDGYRCVTDFGTHPFCNTAAAITP